MTGILFKTVNLEEEKMLINNCIYWMSEMITEIKEEAVKDKIQSICELINAREYKGQFD